MKLNFAETLLVNNPARALVQHYYEASALRQLGGRLDGGRVLEVGCGQGVGVRILLDRFGAAQVFGFDLDIRQVRRARRRLGASHRIVLAVASAEQIPFASESFDAVFDFGILHHVVEWQRAVAEIRRVLRPGGRFFFEEVTRAALNRWSYRTFLKHPKDNRFSETEFVDELAANGIRLLGENRHVMANDIFIGAGKRG